MCKPASFVVTKNRVYWSKVSNGHQDIISENNLQHLDKKDFVDLLRVEITPYNGDFTLKQSLWKYKVDQDILPKWYQPEDTERRVRRALKDWRKWWYTTQEGGDNATQTADYNATQTAGDLSTQNAGNRATQTAGDLSTQNAGNRATQTAGCKATQTAGDLSTQTAGVGTLQIIRYYHNGWKCFTRIVTKEQAGKRYQFSDGIWVEVIL